LYPKSDQYVSPKSALRWRDIAGEARILPSFKSFIFSILIGGIYYLL